MEILVFILLISIATFFIIFFVFLGINRIRFGLQQEIQPIVLKKKPPSKFKKVFLLISLVLVLSLAIMTIIQLSSNKNIKNLLDKYKLDSKKEALVKYNKSLALQEALRSEIIKDYEANRGSDKIDAGETPRTDTFEGSNEDNPKDLPQDIIKMEDDNKNLQIGPEIFKNDFKPATNSFRNLSNLDTSQASPQKTGKPDDHFLSFAELEGADYGDFFVIRFYDEFADGRFIDSGKSKLRFYPSDDKSTLKITMPVNGLYKHQKIQLPFLLNSYLDIKSINNSRFFIDNEGILEASEDLEPFKLSYLLRRSVNNVDFSAKLTKEKDNDWLQKEYEDMPDEIHGFLDSAKNKSDQFKLATVSAIINSYFGYQIGIQEVLLSEGQTWNSVLKIAIKNNKILIADCDVLSTFSYIYLRYLDIKPVFLIGFLIQTDPINSLTLDKLHAALYLKSGQNWLVYDPTIFTNDLSVKLFEEKYKPISDKTVYPDHKAENDEPLGEKNITQNPAKKFKIKFFEPPAEVIKEFKDNSDPTPSEASVAKSIVMFLKLEEPFERSKIEKDRRNFIIYKLIQFIILSILLYLIFYNLIKN